MGHAPKFYQSLQSPTAPTTMNAAATVGSMTNRIKFTVPGRIAAIGHYRQLNDAGNHIGVLQTDWPSTQILAVSFYPHIATDPAGWQWRYVVPMYRITVGTIYVLGVFMGAGLYSYTPGLLAADYVKGPITVPADQFSAHENGWFKTCLPGNQALDGISNPAHGWLFGLDVRFLAD